MNPYIRSAPLFLLFGFLFIVSLGIFDKDNDKKFSAEMIGKTPDYFSLPTLGAPTKIFNPTEWKGKVVVLNLFASWCAPCKLEHPVMMKLAQSGKVHVYGIAWRDTEENIIKWLNERGNPYQLIGVDQVGDSALALGMSGVPETFVFDKEGKIIYNLKGEVTQEEVDKVILPLIEKNQ